MLPYKVDILQTIQACVEQYRNPQSSLGPYVDRLWSSIKFEVRHGDVKERIDASLGVLRSVANKLAEDLLGENSDTALVRFLDMVSKDCSDDLSNPLYAKQAGLLFVTIATANLQTFTRQGPGLLSALRKAYGTAQSVAQKTDALSLLQLFLRGRQSLLKKDEPRDVAARVLALSEVAFRLEDIWTEDLAPLLSDAPWDTSSDVLGQVLRTAALLASQQSLTETGAAVQSCSRSTYDAMIKVLGSHLFTNRENGHSGTRNSTPDHLSVDNEALLCAIAVVNHYRSGFKQMADMAFEPVHACLRREPRSAFSRLQCSLARLEFIGCAELPSDTSVRDLGGVCDEGPYSSAQHLLCVYRCLLQPLRESFLLSGSSQAHGLQAVLLSGIYRATLVFQDALSHRCTVEATGSTANTEDSGDGEDWTQDFACLSLSVVPPVGSVALPLICEDDLLGARRLSLKAGLYVVWTLYRDILLDPRTDACEDVLSLLSGLAALVIKSMSAARQQVLRLADQMFDLFIRGEETVESRAKPVFREYLVLGIAHGLHPAVMEGLVR